MPERRLREGLRAVRAWLSLIFLACLLPASLHPQTLLKASARVDSSDLAVLADTRQREDLPCSVSPVKPEIGFDLRFHSGYSVAIPLQPLRRAGRRLHVLMRIIPLDDPKGVRYLADRISIPPLGTHLRGEAQFPGEFVLGPGRYKVDWLVRNGAKNKKVCSAHWELEAKPPGWLERELRPVASNAVGERTRDLFKQSRPAERTSQDRRLHVKLLVNFSPSNHGAVTLKSWELRAIISIMRSVVRDPQLGRFSLVAFSMREQKILFRQNDVPSIDFPALGKAVSGLTFGTIDYRRLADPMSGTRFLTALLTESFAGQADPLDAIVIIGPKVMLDKKIPKQALRNRGWPHCPIFYLNYNSDPRRNPWRDAIGAALQFYRGLEYAITRPKDLASALRDMRKRLSDRQWQESFLRRDSVR